MSVRARRLLYKQALKAVSYKASARTVSCAVMMQKVCITVPGVRPLGEEELNRRLRAVELIRSGTSKCFTSCHNTARLAMLPYAAYAVPHALSASSQSKYVLHVKCSKLSHQSPHGCHGCHAIALEQQFMPCCLANSAVTSQSIGHHSDLLSSCSATAIWHQCCAASSYCAWCSKVVYSKEFEHVMPSLHSCLMTSTFTSNVSTVHSLIPSRVMHRLIRGCFRPPRLDTSTFC